MDAMHIRGWLSVHSPPPEKKRAARLAPEAAQVTAVGEAEYSGEMGGAQGGVLYRATPAALLSAALNYRRSFPSRPLPRSLQQQIGRAWLRRGAQ